MLDNTGSPPNAAPAQTDVASLLVNLRKRFSEQLGGRLNAVREQIQRLVQTGITAVDIESLHREVHGLTGAAGTFGMPKVSDTARTLENLLAPLKRAEGICDPALALMLTDALAQLEIAAAQPLKEPFLESSVPLAPVAHSDMAVHWLETGSALSSELRNELAEARFRVQGFNQLSALQNAFDTAAPPAALVLDLTTPEAVAPALELVRGLGMGRPPVLAALPNDDLATRLIASRAGVHRSLSRPLDARRIVGVLETLTGRLPPVPYRVLLVDDDPLLLEAQSGVLRQAGMEVRSLSDPLQTLAELETFSPDVLLLDVYMPHASGPELAAALRERDAHVHLPILFLSAETDLTQQLLALNLGGDDFLVKPVQPSHLVAAVSARARRARQAEALRKRLQTTLYEREREHLALNHHAIVSIADHFGHITYANDMFCELSGYSRSELLGKHHHLLISKVHEKGFVGALLRTLKSGKVWHGEVCCQRKDGSPYWVEATVTPFLDEAGAVYQYVTIQTDISHIKATEAALRTQRDMQRVISMAAARLMAASVTQTPKAIDAALKDSGTQLGADRAYLFRFSKDGTTMTNTHDWYAEGVAPMANPGENMPIETTPWMREQFLRHGQVVIQDVDTLPPEAAMDQQELRFKGLKSMVVFPLFNNNQFLGFIAYSVLQASKRSEPRIWTSGEVGLLKMLSDVIASALARHITERKLRKSESRLNFLVSSSPVAIYTREAVEPFVLSFVSPNVQQLVGLDASFFAADTHQGLDLVHPDDQKRFAENLPKVLELGADLYEYRLRRADGTYCWVQDQRRLVHDSNGTPMEIVGCWMDITERKQFETELSAFNQELERRVDEQTRAVVESERFARATLDALSARVVILNGEGLVLAANRAWEILGLKDLVREGSSYVDVCDKACGLSAEAGRPLADGIRAVIRGELKEFLHEYICRREETPRWFLCRVERFPGEGEVRAVVSHENITEMKLAERQQLRSQRLESLGTLAGGVAHDLNNALAPVLMGMNILKEQYPEESKLFEMIESSAQRGTHMVRQLLTFAKGADGERVTVLPHQMVQEMERLMRGSFPKSIELRVQSQEKLPSVVGDPTQLHQVLLNLCVNARDAMPGGGILSVLLRKVEMDATSARSIPDAAPGQYLMLRVSDTGTGIPPEILDRIFDPFFTTKSSDKGTGLGLSTVLGIVKGHGGFLQVQSEPGAGTAFTVYLPAAMADKPPRGDTTDVGLAIDDQGHGETILFVDDESAVREVGKTVLERLQYRALVATDGADGLVLAADNKNNLSVVITDLHMPHMDGLAFVRALRRTLPEVPVVLASGRVDESVWTELQSLGVDHRLDKPFTQEQLARTLGEVLGQ